MGRIAIFIDAAYLQFTLREEFNTAKIDFNKLVNGMADGREILRSYYYDCEPYQSNPPTAEEMERFGRAQRFHYALDQIPRQAGEAGASWPRQQRKANLSTETG